MVDCVKKENSRPNSGDKLIGSAYGLWEPELLIISRIK